MIGNYMRNFFTLMALSFSLTALAQTDEEKVGKAAAAQVLGAAPLVAADVAQQYVNVLGHALSAHSGVTPAALRGERPGRECRVARL